MAKRNRMAGGGQDQGVAEAVKAPETVDENQVVIPRGAAVPFVNQDVAASAAEAAAVVVAEAVEQDRTGLAIAEPAPTVDLEPGEGEAAKVAKVATTDEIRAQMADLTRRIEDLRIREPQRIAAIIAERTTLLDELRGLQPQLDEALRPEREAAAARDLEARRRAKDINAEQ